MKNTEGFIQIINAGISSIQDAGRTGYRAFGVPISGNMDQKSAAIANFKLGKSYNEAVIEIFYSRFKFKISYSTALAFSGAVKSVSINGDLSGVEDPIAVFPNDVVELSKIENGYISYMAFQGNLAIEPVMGSYATDTVSKIGGFNGHYLMDGDKIPISFNSKDKYERFSGEKERVNQVHALECRIIAGPELSQLGKPELDYLFSSSFVISKESNRMGYRLEGKIPLSSKVQGIHSSATLPGTIQMTESGNLIVLMKDGQVTGGYPRIGSIIASDLCDFAQIMPGKRLSFKLISYQEALKDYIEFTKAYLK